MRIALVNPQWTFDGSIYFGCTASHLPLEYGYARALLEQKGHEVIIVDATLDAMSPESIRAEVERFGPDFTVITTAPSYLFWRCTPPELRVPQMFVRELHAVAGTLVVVGPHASTTPAATLRKLGADVAILGEFEEILAELVETPRARWPELQSIAYLEEGGVRVQGAPHESDMRELPALRWSQQTIQRHRHHHHRFDAPPQGPGAEIETSRGCPYQCTFCAKENFRNRFRRRPVPTIMEELDGLLEQGIEYVYFIDEIFLPNQEILSAVAERGVVFGVQTRIDLWNLEMIELLGRAGCVSIEAGIESITVEGRRLLNKNCKLSTDELVERLVYAKRYVPFVQANLMATPFDQAQAIQEWREYLHSKGVWANMPVPLFPYPGSPDYTKLWGLPDDYAWERALNYYLELNKEFSDIQQSKPLPLSQLELVALHE